MSCSNYANCYNCKKKYSCGGQGSYASRDPNPNYIPPASVVITWQCKYCDSVNKFKKLKCKNCGAPRRSNNEQTY